MYTEKDTENEKVTLGRAEEVSSLMMMHVNGS